MRGVDGNDCGKANGQQPRADGRRAVTVTQWAAFGHRISYRNVAYGGIWAYRDSYFTEEGSCTLQML